MSTKVSDSRSAPAKTSSREGVPSSSRKSNFVGKFFLLVTLLGLLSAAVWGSGQYLDRLSSRKRESVFTHTVIPGELLVTVTEDGNVESASNLEMKCQVAGGSSILWIVPDGSTVKAGDKLVELDTAALDEQINTQRIAYEKARSAKIQAEKNYEVAKLSVREYIEGTYKQLIQDAEALITIAMENLRSAQNSLEHAERMFRKGYVSSLELEGQRFSVARANLELDSARTAKAVLVDFTKVKTLQELESLRDTAEAQMNSEKSSFDLEEARLKRLESQIAQCTITANQDGMVVYANESGGRFGQQQASVEEGAAVRERQTILRLPDLTKMQVKVNVHESKVEQMKPGMRARIRILDREMTGTVTTIANQPEPSGWFSANVKEYATIVRIDGQPEGLRPGMTAEVEILVAHLTDALSLPVASVVEQKGNFFCWVVTPEGYTKRPIVVGASNDQFIEVKEGLVAEEEVLLNPRAVVAEARATLEEAQDEAVNVKERFGEATSPPIGVGAPFGAEGPRAAGGSPEAGGNAGGGRPRGGNLMQFDTDKDGKVSREEAPEPMRERFDMMDTDGDGFIDSSDLEKMRQQFPSGGGPGGPAADRPGGPGRPAGPPSGGAN